MEEQQNSKVITIKISKAWINPVTIGAIGTALLLCVYLLTKHDEGLDHLKVATQVQQEFEKEANLKLKSVSCPEGIPKLTNLAFECQGQINPQKTFPITVKQKDDEGNLEWDVPNSPVVLNLKELASDFQDAIASQSGKRAVVTCSGKYRVVKSGDTFDCALQGGQGDKLSVKIDSTGGVAWQEVLPATPVAVASAPTPAPATPSATPAAATPEAKTVEPPADKATDKTADKATDKATDKAETTAAKADKPEAKTAAATETAAPDPTQDKKNPPGEQLDDPYNWD